MENLKESDPLRKTSHECQCNVIKYLGEIEYDDWLLLVQMA
jgi:hypothetical protein